MMQRSLVVLLVAALGASAAAQPEDPADVALAEGRRLYDLREFSAAIERFKEAYRLRNDAASLFNIAQSYRLLNDCPNAYEFYKTFQRNFPNERPDVVAKFIAELEPCKRNKVEPPKKPDEPPKKPDEPPKKPDEPPKKPDVAPPLVVTDDARPGGTLRIAGLVVGGAGGAAVATGVFFGLRSRSQSRELDNSDEWNPSLDASAKRADRNAKIFLGVGGAAMLGGAVLFYLGHRAGESAGESANVALIPSADGVEVTWSFWFE